LIVEAGIGGEKDVTNILDTDLLLITSIGFDHCEILGDTLADITRQKAGLMRPHKPVIYAGDNPEVTQVIADLAKTVGAEFCKEMSSQCTTADSTLLDSLYPHPAPLPSGRGDAEKLAQTVPSPLREKDRMRGLKQLYGYARRPDFSRYPALLIHALNLLCQKLPFQIESDTVQRCLETLSVPARLSQMSYHGKTVILDVAHNAESIHRLSDFLHDRDITHCSAVFGFEAGRSLESVLSSVLDQVIAWHLPTIPDDRVLTKEAVAGQLKEITVAPISLYEDSLQAFQAAIQNTQVDTVLVFGSFTVVGPVWQYLKEQGCG